VFLRVHAWKGRARILGEDSAAVVSCVQTIVATTMVYGHLVSENRNGLAAGDTVQSEQWVGSLQIIVALR